MPFFSKAKRSYLAAAEYWVYLPEESMPDQDEVMTRMIAENPHSKSGYSAIEAKEGLLFSDIRLHVSLILRSKNPHVFRPDLLHDPVEPTPETLEALSAAKAAIKVRYVSEERLADDRHLQFMPHLADAYADLGQGLAVYDVVAQKLVTAGQFKESLDRQLDATGYDDHVRVIWQKGGNSGHAETRGLIKHGLPELQTDEANLDQRVLVCEVLSEAGKAIWEMSEPPKELDLAAYGDKFHLEITPARSGPYKVRILRFMHV